jgi:hypothetical protein
MRKPARVEVWVEPARQPESNFRLRRYRTPGRYGLVFPETAMDRPAKTFPETVHIVVSGDKQLKWSERTQATSSRRRQLFI